MAGNTALTAKTEFEQEKKEPKAPETQTDNLPNAITVNHLPDIKLNDNIISKTVMDYAPAENLKSANQALLQGQTDEALKLLAQQALSADLKAKDKAQAYLNSAVIYLQRREYKKALAEIDEAIKITPEDPFAQLLKVWTYSAWGKNKETKKAAENLLFLTADFEYLSSSKLAWAISYFNKGQKKEAMDILQNLYGTNPYIISHAAYLMGLISFKDYKISSALFEQALTHDKNNYMAQKQLALIQYKLKDYIPAWQSYASLFILDRQDKKTAKKLKKLTKKLPFAPEDYLFYTRLSEIFSQKSEPLKSPALRVGLFSDYSANLTPVKSFEIMPGSAFTIKDEGRGTIISGEPFAPKTIVFDDDKQGVHIQNKWGAADFSTKKPFVINMNKDGASFLVKNAKAEDIFAANLGDKELKGSLVVIPAQKGMYLINYTDIDNVLPALLMSITRGIKTPAALEAAAITLRTALLSHLNQGSNELFDLPDNSPRASYGGVNMESSFVKEAVKNTGNKVLALKEGEDLSVLAQADIYQSCSAITEDGIKNTEQKMPYTFTPANLFKFMLSNPPKDLYSAPQDPTLWSSIKWAYSIPLKDIEARLKQKHKIGSLRYFEPGKISPYGRIESFKFKGSKKTVEVPFEEANFILAAGTLRSPFFTFIPFKKEVLFLGTDTGLGKGLCIDGAYGMARGGKTAEEILKYYYPDLEITEKWQTKKSLL